MEQKIKFVVIGLGHIGQRHSAMIHQNKEAELVAVVDTQEQCSTHATALSVPFYTSINALLNDTDIQFDVANICTPNGLHAQQSIQILTHRKHVVCEKPMGLTKDSCEQVIFKALQQSKFVFCVMQNRYSPPAQWIKSVIDEEKLGRIYMVQLNCYWNRGHHYYQQSSWKGTQELDGGILFTQFSHFIDIMYWLFGDIKNIAAQFANFRHQDITPFEDSGFIHFDFVQGGMGSINYSTAVAHKNLESSMTIIGEKGSVKIGGQYMNKVEICDIKDYTMPDLPPTNPGNDYGKYKGSAANHQYIIQNVIDTIKGKNTATTNAMEGLKVVEIIERIYTLKK